MILLPVAGFCLARILVSSGWHPLKHETMANVLVRKMAGLSVSGFSRPSIPLANSIMNASISVRSLTARSLVPSAASFLDHRWPVHRSPNSGVVTMTSSYMFSSMASAKTTPGYGSSKQQQQQQRPEIVTTEDGRKYAVVNTTYQKLKPSIVRKRLEKMKTYLGREKDIKYSPYRMRLLCNLVTGMPLLEALEQLRFNHKAKAPDLARILKRTSNLADIRDGIQMSQLEIAECFATPGNKLKSITFHSKGRAGKRWKRFSHVRIILREIDFPLRIYQARSINQKKKWIERQLRAERDAEVATAEREELARLEKQAAEKEKTKA